MISTAQVRVALCQPFVFVWLHVCVEACVLCVGGVYGVCRCVREILGSTAVAHSSVGAEYKASARGIAQPGLALINLRSMYMLVAVELAPASSICRFS